jgi:hypothetical protein
MLYLYNENLFLGPRLKQALKKILGNDARGPRAVFSSLISGLLDLGEAFVVNKQNETIETACVISGVRTLKWAIKKKQQGKIKKIVAGPNLVISPNDENGILKNGLIDVIVVPSLWVKEHYVKIYPSLESKIKIWPAGVSLPILSNEKKVFDFLVFNKLKSPELLNGVCKGLEQLGFFYKVLEYGKFKQKNYFSWLEQAKYEIYLSNSESQGLAMFEAWARGVPTLVWESGKITFDGVTVTGKISAPFLNTQSGMSFSSKEEFLEKLKNFTSLNFDSRKYIEENFTNKIVGEKYLEIVKNIL